MRFLKERRQVPPPEAVKEPIPLWQLRIQQSHGFLISEIEALRGVVPGSPEETELSWSVANRVGNFTRAILNANGVGSGVSWRELDAIGLSADIPAYIQLQEFKDGSRVYYAPLRNEVSHVQVLRTDLFRRRIYNIGAREIKKPEEWGKDEAIRGRVVDKMMGLLPDEVRSGLSDLNQGIKRR